MKYRGIFAMVLISLAVSSAFADSVSMVQVPIMEALTKTFQYVGTILGSIVAITLLPMAWVYVSSVIWRSGRNNDEKLFSDISSRKEARDRLKAHGIGEKELNLSSYRKAVEAEKFRKKFGTFEEWQNSSNYRRTRGIY